MRDYWKPNVKFPCEHCGKEDYLDYYCGGCDECCGKILAAGIDQEKLKKVYEEFEEMKNEGQK